MSARQRMSATILLLALFGLGFVINNSIRAADPEPKKADAAKSESKEQRLKRDPADYSSGIDWPEPKIITAGKTNVDPPSDAIVLFGGENLDEWKDGKNWKVKDGVATADKSGIRTKKSFGDIQLHIEWATPEVVKGEGQGRGNSGVYIMGLYEVQILDSYENKTYFDGQAGALYKQVPPLVNVCRKPGEWQAYDILFTAPKFEKGKVTKKATITVLQNGVVVQNHFELPGGTYYDRAPEYKAHAPKLPISLQYHGNPIRFKNIWVREL